MCARSQGGIDLQVLSWYESLPCKSSNKSQDISKLNKAYHWIEGVQIVYKYEDVLFGVNAGVCFG